MHENRKRIIVQGIEEAINVSDILDEILIAIKDNCDPEDVFDTEDLETWAENNGYTKEESE